VEIPSYFITWYAMDRLGRRWVLCVTMMLGGLACVSCMFVPEGTTSSIQISLINKNNFIYLNNFRIILSYFIYCMYADM